MKQLIALTILFCAGGLAQSPAHSVTLNWNWSQGAGGVATGFTVSRGGTSGGPYSTQACTTTSATVTTCVDTAGLVEGTTYYYVVVATGPGGSSTPSNEASAKIPFLLPSPPATLSAVPK